MARRKDWGVCRSCWKHKLAGNTAKEKAYDEWWDTHKDVLNHEDEKRERRVLGLEEPPVLPHELEDNTKKRKRKDSTSSSSDGPDDLRVVASCLSTASILREVISTELQSRKRCMPESPRT